MNQEVLLHSPQWMGGERHVCRTVCADHHQLRRASATRESGNEIDRGRIYPMQILQNQHERSLGSNRLQGLADLTQHPLPCGALDFALHGLALLTVLPAQETEPAR